MTSLGPEEHTRVLHVFGRMNRGGAEMRTLDVLRSIDRTQFGMDFCVLSRLRGELDEEIQALGGSLHYCKLGFSFPVQFMLLLRRERYDVVHSHVLYVSGIMLLLARIAGVKARIAHFRTSSSGKRRSLFLRARDWFLRALIHRYATDIVAVSDSALEASWLTFFDRDSRCRTIYNAVVIDKNALGSREKVRQEVGVSRESRLLVHIGRFMPVKNHKKLIGVFREVLRSDPSAVLLLVGHRTQEEQEKVQLLFEKADIVSNVKFTGVRTDVPRLLAAADLLIFPSLWEGLPGAVLEASAVGTPVLASEIPPHREIQLHLPSVTLCSLDASDAEWAQSALEAISRWSSHNDRLCITDSFEKSPFTVEPVLEEYRRLWNGVRG